MSSATNLPTCLHCIFVKESSHYKLAGKKNPKQQNTPKSPAGTMASSTQDFFPAKDKDNLLISFPPSELHLIDSTEFWLSLQSHLINLEEWGSLLGEEGSGQGFSLPSLPFQMGHVPHTERVQSAWMRRSALALRTETFHSYNYIEELYAFWFRVTGLAWPSLRAV